jgi:hypothetical protein
VRDRIKTRFELPRGQVDVLAASPPAFELLSQCRSPKDALQFTHQFGFLHYPPRLNESQPISKVLWEAARLRAALHFHRCLPDADGRRALAPFVRFDKSGPNVTVAWIDLDGRLGGVEEYQENENSFLESVKHLPQKKRRYRWPPCDALTINCSDNKIRERNVIDASRAYLALFVNGQIQGQIEYQLFLDSGNAVPYLAPANLRACLWFQIARMISGEDRYNVCLECGGLIPLRHHRRNCRLHPKCTRKRVNRTYYQKRKLQDAQKSEKRG